jgi:hypothetical protein
LKETLSPECINELCLIVKERKCLPEELIFEKNSLVSQLYFIKQGKLRICYDKKKNQLMKES